MAKQKAREGIRERDSREEFQPERTESRRALRPSFLVAAEQAVEKAETAADQIEADRGRVDAILEKRQGFWDTMDGVQKDYEERLSKLDQKEKDKRIAKLAVSPDNYDDLWKAGIAAAMVRNELVLELGEESVNVAEEDIADFALETRELLNRLNETIVRIQAVPEERRLAAAGFELDDYLLQRKIIHEKLEAALEAERTRRQTEVQQEKEKLTAEYIQLMASLNEKIGEEVDIADEAVFAVLLAEAKEDYLKHLKSKEKVALLASSANGVASRQKNALEQMEIILGRSFIDELLVMGDSDRSAALAGLGEELRDKYAALGKITTGLKAAGVNANVLAPILDTGYRKDLEAIKSNRQNEQVAAAFEEIEKLSPGTTQELNVQIERIFLLHNILQALGDIRGDRRERNSNGPSISKPGGDPKKKV